MNKELKHSIIISTIGAISVFILFSFWEFFSYILWDSTTFNIPFWIYGLIGVICFEVVFWILYFHNKRKK